MEFPSFLVYNIAKKLSGDNVALGVFQLFATGVMNPFKVLDRVDYPIEVAISGQLNLVQWLFPFLTKAEDEQTKSDMFSHACDNEHNEVIIWLAENGCPVSKYELFGLPGHGHVDIFKTIVLRSKDTTMYGTCPCDSAAYYGNLELLIWLSEKGFTWSEDACTGAAEGGHLDCLTYLHEHDCPWDETVIRDSIVYEHMSCLMYACDNECPRTAESCKHAAYEGKTGYLMYLYKSGCPWDKRTCEAAAKRGNFDCLLFAHINGCPWDENLIVSARQALEYVEDGDNIRLCIAFAIANGCPGGDL